MWWRAGLVVLALGLAFLPLPPAAVERWYSNGIYPVLQSALTSSSNRVSFALFDLGVIALLAWVAWRLARVAFDWMRLGWIRTIVRAAISIVTASALLYVAFLTTWGLNYRRMPLRSKLQYDERLLTVARARELAETIVSRLNELHRAAHAEPQFAMEGADNRLSSAFDDTVRILGVRQRTTVGRPKQSLLDPYFHAAAVDGMTDPFFLESLIASELVPVERPFVVAHEWSHLAGFADESEANFVGWLACVHGSPALQYSGWLFLYSDVVNGLARDDRAAVTARLTDGPRDDLRAIAERVRRQMKPAVSIAGWRAYDQYLKANRVESGTASYAQVVQLVLGAKFGPDWRPLLRR